ncbi:MAG: GWxTD domain-containing protein [Bacteroidales bacterium]|nr:GWxTD domain-containing protein [Bacteroidales bacterium]
MNDKMMSSLFLKRFSLLLVVIILTAATPMRKLSKKNLAYLYDRSDFTDVSWMVYHVSEKSSRIYGDISLKGMSYRHAWNNDGEARAKFQVTFHLLESYESKDIIDSSTMIFTDSLHFGTDLHVVISNDFHTPYKGDYLLKVLLTDMNNPENNLMDYVHVYKSNRLSAQNFMITDENGNPIFQPVLEKEEKFVLKYNDPDRKELTVRYYNREFPLAQTPFALDRRETYTFKPDSLYTLELNNGISSLLEFPFRGIYFIQPDKEQPEGYTIFRFEDSFPTINTTEKALRTLRYLTTEAEFNKLNSYQDQKMAIDSFWLDRASNNPERARNMIKRYYNRVEFANREFTSYHDGWKTDRGLVYIIYGPPSEVYRKTDEEEWIYGERGNPLSIRFFFDKVENPFTQNDYSLQRSPVYKTSWYIAIENWKR